MLVYVIRNARSANVGCPPGNLAVLAKSQTARHREVQRARVLLLAAEGLANIRIADQVG